MKVSGLDSKFCHEEQKQLETGDKSSGKFER
jgi:hypothetical protein